MPFALLLLLAMDSGGYDTVGRSRLGIVIWWIVLVWAVAQDRARPLKRRTWLALGLLTAFAVWTAVNIPASESPERGMLALNRVVMYLGVMVVALGVVRRAHWRHALNGIACAIAVVSCLAVLSRLLPWAFAMNDHLEFLPASANRLSYPLSYWGLLGGFVALGVPLLLTLAVGARTVLGRASATAVMPICLLCVYMTISRDGSLALMCGLIGTLVVAPRRTEIGCSLVVAGLGGAVLIGLASRLDALQSAQPSTAATGQGLALLLVALIVAVVCARAQIALERRGPFGRVTFPRFTRGTIVAVALLALIAALASGVPAVVEAQWHHFSGAPTQMPAAPQGDLFARLGSSSSNGRYQLWASAVDAVASNPLRGIGPGSFEFWWARNGTGVGFLRYAHSLYFQTLAELGVVGLLLIGGYLALAVCSAARRARRGPGVEGLAMAGAVGCLISFVVIAGFEWAWEMAVLPVTAIIVFAVVLEGSAQATALPPCRRRPHLRIAAATLALVSLVTMAIPLFAAVALSASQQDARAGDTRSALDMAHTAIRAEPYAASAQLQLALVREQAGDLDGAAGAARAAALAEPTNWRTWMVRSRLAALRGLPQQAVVDMRRARQLNPRYTPFAQP